MNFNSIVLFILGVYQALDTRGSLGENGKNILSIFLIIIGGIPVIINFLSWLFGHGPKIQSVLDGVLISLTFDFYMPIKRFMHLRGFGIYCSDKEMKSYYHQGHKFYLGEINKNFKFSLFNTWKISENVGLCSCTPPGQEGDPSNIHDDIEIMRGEFYMVFHFDPLFIRMENYGGIYKIIRSYKGSVQSYQTVVERETYIKIAKIYKLCQREELVTNVRYSNFRRTNIYHSCNVFYLIKYVESRAPEEIRVSFIGDLNGYVEDSLSSILNGTFDSCKLKGKLGEDNFEVLKKYCLLRKIPFLKFCIWASDCLKKMKIHNGVSINSNFKNWEEKRMVVDFSEFCSRAGLSMKVYKDKSIKVTKEMFMLIKDVKNNIDDNKCFSEIHEKGLDQETIESIEGTKFEGVITRISNREFKSKRMNSDLDCLRKQVASNESKGPKEKVILRGKYYQALMKEILGGNENYCHSEIKTYKKVFESFVKSEILKGEIMERLGIILKFKNMKPLLREEIEESRMTESYCSVPREIKKKKYPNLSNRQALQEVKLKIDYKINMRKKEIKRDPINYINSDIRLFNKFNPLFSVKEAEENDISLLFSKICKNSKSDNFKSGKRNLRSSFFSFIRSEAKIELDRRKYEDVDEIRLNFNLGKVKNRRGSNSGRQNRDLIKSELDNIDKLSYNKEDKENIKKNLKNWGKKNPKKIKEIMSKIKKTKEGSEIFDIIKKSEIEPCFRRKAEYELNSIDNNPKFGKRRRKWEGQFTGLSEKLISCHKEKTESDKIKMRKEEIEKRIQDERKKMLEEDKYSKNNNKKWNEERIEEKKKIEKLKRKRELRESLMKEREIKIRIRKEKEEKEKEEKLIKERELGDSSKAFKEIQE